MCLFLHVFSTSVEVRQKTVAMFNCSKLLDTHALNQSRFVSVETIFYYIDNRLVTVLTYRRDTLPFFFVVAIGYGGLISTPLTDTDIKDDVITWIDNYIDIVTFGVYHFSLTVVFTI